MNHDFDEQKTDDTTKRFLEFHLGKDAYGIELLKVREVITLPELTPIPKAPAYVCGLMNLRGLVLTVIDLRKRMNITPMDKSTETAVIVFDLGDRMVGAVVDSIEKVLNVKSSSIKPLPNSEGEGSKYLLGVLQQDERLIMWLDPQSLMDAHVAAPLQLKTAA